MNYKSAMCPQNYLTVKDK